MQVQAPQQLRRHQRRFFFFGSYLECDAVLASVLLGWGFVFSGIVVSRYFRRVRHRCCRPTDGDQTDFPFYFDSTYSPRSARAARAQRQICKGFACRRFISAEGADCMYFVD